MPRAINSSMAAAAALAAVFAFKPTEASAECAPFEVFEDTFEGQLVDHGNDGRSAGDVHLGTRRIVDADGTHVGHQHWVATVVDADNTHVNARIELDDGEIHASGMMVGIGGAKNHESAQFQTMTTVIHGGTGAYLHASGTFEMFKEGDATRLVVTIRCN